MGNQLSRLTLHLMQSFLNRIVTILNTRFLFQVHEMAMVSAVQEAQKDNLRSFNDYMMKVLEVSVILPFMLWHTMIFSVFFV